jgi:hypothetical protein
VASYFMNVWDNRGCDFWCVFLPIEMNWELVWDEAKITFETRPHHGLWSGILYNNMVLLYGKGNSHSRNVDTLSSSVGGWELSPVQVSYMYMFCHSHVELKYKRCSFTTEFFFLNFIFKHILHSSCMVLWRS